MMTDDSVERAITAFGRAAALLDGPRLHVWDERGVSLQQLRILFRVRQAPGIGAKELAARLGVSASAITQQVERLTSRGLVARTDRPEDRRHIALTLTAEGEQVVGEYSLVARDFLRQALRGLDATELEQLTQLLTRIVDQAPSLAEAMRAS